MIAVHQDPGVDPLAFTVTVRDDKGETRHAVTMARKTFDAISTGKRTPAEVIDAAFRFLLEREPKESILTLFDVTVIARYFPEFPRELPRYLERE